MPLLSILLTLSIVSAQEEIVVESASDAPPGSATEVPITPLWSAEADVAEVLSGVAGASVRRLGPPGSFALVGLRGSSARQVSVHLDGIPLNPDGADAFDLSDLPLTMLSSMLVFRGFAPPWYGASGMGGVLDLQTPTGATVPLSFRTSLGSFGTMGLAGRGGVRWTGVLPGDLFVAADHFGTRGTARYFDDAGTRFTDDDDAFRTRRNADQQRFSGFARLRLAPGSLHLTLVDHILSRGQGLPGAIGAPAESARFHTVRNLLSLSADGHVGSTRLHGRAWHLSRIETLDDKLAELGVGTAWQRDTGHILGGSLRVQSVLTPWASLTGVAEARWEQSRRRPLTDLIPETLLQRSVFAGTLGMRLHAEDVLAASPVVDIRYLDAEDGDTFAASPRLALTARPTSQLTLRSQVGRYLRPPGLFELAGDRGDRAGNPTLRPERGWQADVGLDLAAANTGPVRLAASGTAFVNDATDLIVWIQNAQRTSLPVNLGRARIYGVESALQVDVGEVLQGRSALTFLDARNLVSEGRQVPNVPRWQVDQRVLVSPTPWLQVGWDSHFIDGTFVDLTNWLRAAPRMLHGLTARLRPVADGPVLELRVSNLANRIREQVVADPLVGASSGRVWQPVVDFVGYPLAGRSFLLTLSWTGTP